LLVFGTYWTLIRGKSGSLRKIGKRGGCRAWYFILLPPVSFVASLGAIGVSVLTLQQGTSAFQTVVVSIGLVASFGTVCYAMYNMYCAVYTHRSEGVLSDFILEWYESTAGAGEREHKTGLVTRVTSQMVTEFLTAQKKLQAKKAQASAARKQRRETVLQVSEYCRCVVSSEIREMRLLSR
jgi:hypothetical protein